MVQEIMRDEAFLSQKAEPATLKDLPVAQDLLDTLTAYPTPTVCCGRKCNPGSCGGRRFDQEITLAVMTVDGGHFQVEKVMIPHEKK